MMLLPETNNAVERKQNILERYSLYFNIGQQQKGLPNLLFVRQPFNRTIRSNFYSQNWLLSEKHQ